MGARQKKFDVAVIGAGPGGYPAAIRAAQRGLSVALVEAKEVGGTCLNRGCIPTKALVANAALWRSFQQAEKQGITIGSASFDFAKMAQRKDDIVNGMRKGLTGLIASNQIILLQGVAELLSSKEIKIKGKEPAVIEADKIILAMGSEPRPLAAFPFDGQRIHDSTSILKWTSLPKVLVIIGGGIIGVEFASLYSALGVEVIILELMPTIIPTEDPSVSSFLAASFLKRGIQIRTQVVVKEIVSHGSGVQISLGDGSFLAAESALVAVGRSINTTNIGLEKAGVLTNDKGFVIVDDKMETTVPGIYAVGDITGKWLLAHVASHQGIVAASNATGEPAHMDYRAVPSVIFTDPEIATVGLSLPQALSQGYSAKTAAFPFHALGKSQAASHIEGFAQLVVDASTGQILGGQVIGYEASTLIAEIGVAIANELTVECLAEAIHAHPTLSEAWHEAASLAMGMPLHLPKRASAFK